MYVSTIIYSSTIHSVVNERWTIDRLDARLGACAFARGQKSWTIRIKCITSQHKQTVECSHHLAWSFTRMVDSSTRHRWHLLWNIVLLFDVHTIQEITYLFRCVSYKQNALFFTHILSLEICWLVFCRSYCTDNTSQRHQLQRSQFDFVLILIPLHYEINIH